MTEIIILISSLIFLLLFYFLSSRKKNINNNSQQNKPVNIEIIKINYNPLIRLGEILIKHQTELQNSECTEKNINIIEKICNTFKNLFKEIYNEGNFKNFNYEDSILYLNNILKNNNCDTKNALILDITIFISFLLEFQKKIEQELLLYGLKVCPECTFYNNNDINFCELCHHNFITGGSTNLKIYTKN